MEPQAEGAERQKEMKMEKEMEVPPTEDLMREHGVLKRILLVYEDSVKRLVGEKPMDPYRVYPVIFNAAVVTRRFVEDYHQQLEEQYVFPVFLKEGEQVDLVRVLLEQHTAARQLTDLILMLPGFQTGITGGNGFNCLSFCPCISACMNPMRHGKTQFCFPLFAN
ncbi:hemerythrin domain-containing protein [Effusibacillus consociatus]|uniref:Hemerythrin domain-containing protein n=1 Tax=Effusibacillus consociatus TaxID=1117041 RepID=A0ABV9PW37_9BACL